MPIHSFQFGRSVAGRPLIGYTNVPEILSKPETPPPLTLLLGGTHGNEPATVHLLERFVTEQLPQVPAKFPTLVVPCWNPDGLQACTRYNANGVDLNRNFPTGWDPHSIEPPGASPLSEPESRALHTLILEIQPRKIVSLHWALAELDADGIQSRDFLAAIWNSLSELERMPYRCRLSSCPDGSACPGSLGQWCGYGLHSLWGWGPAMVTLELPADPLVPRAMELPADHLQTVQERWRRDSGGYLQQAEPAVQKMLLAACRFPAETEKSNHP